MICLLPASLLPLSHYLVLHQHVSRYIQLLTSNGPYWTCRWDGDIDLCHRLA